VVNDRSPRRFKFTQDRARNLKISDVPIPPDNKRTGKTMTAQTIQDLKYATGERAERVQDVLIVSSFALWAMLLGFAPVLAYRLLTA
jgi:hypothetical protein